MTRTIYIEGRFTTQRLTGVQRYASEIARALDRIAGEDASLPQIVLVQPQEGASLGLTNIEERRFASGASHLWTQLHFLRAARGGVALSMAASGPLLHSRQVVVIHDAAVFRHPEFYSASYVHLHRTMDRFLARTARLATVSEFSRTQLSSYLRLDEARIVVAPNGSEHMRIDPDDSVIDRHGIGSAPFFLVLGSITKNKNLAVAMRALDRLRGSAAKLVAVGDLDQGVFGKLSVAPNENVIMPGRLTDAEIVGLMRRARALIFPSIYEGFGIPPLEAMMHGCPVLASTAPAVVETCGPAAEYFEPHDDEKLAHLMSAALEGGEGWREHRVAAGRERAAHYTWERSARILLAACRELGAQRKD